MQTTEPVTTIKSCVTSTLHEADLTGMKPGDVHETPQHAVPYSDGLQWWMEYNPAGDEVDGKGHVSVFLFVNKPVKAVFTCAVDGSSISKTITNKFSDKLEGFGWPQFASHEELRPLFRDGKLTITCSFEFDISAPVVPVPRVFQLFEHLPTDVEFAIESERVPAHKSFLASISPVFQAMFSHNTAESKCGKIIITEFDFESVEAAIDICYGRKLTNLPVETAVGVLRFCDKYFITAVIIELEKLPFLKPSVENFCTIIQYAYDCYKNELMTACIEFFKNHHDEIKDTSKFAELQPTFVYAILKLAFDLKTICEVLHHAHKNGIGFVVEYMERRLIDSLNLDNFCPAVNFAWDCSREELKLACAKFLNDHRDEVLDSKTFRQLHEDTIGKVLKASCVLKYGVD